MLRGGSWNNNPQNCRVANRNNNTPGNRNNNVGFRLANTGKYARDCRLYGCGRCGKFLSSRLSCSRLPVGTNIARYGASGSPDLQGEGRAVFFTKTPIYTNPSPLYIRFVATHKRYALIYTVYMVCRYIGIPISKAFTGTYKTKKPPSRYLLVMEAKGKRVIVLKGYFVLARRKPTSLSRLPGE